MQINESQLRRIVREELFGFGKKKPIVDETAVKAALAAFMKALQPALGGSDSANTALSNLRSRIVPMLQDVVKFVATRG